MTLSRRFDEYQSGLALCCASELKPARRASRLKRRLKLRLKLGLAAKFHGSLR